MRTQTFFFIEPACCADNRSNSWGEGLVLGSSSCTKKVILLKRKEKSCFCKVMTLGDCCFLTSPYYLSSSRDMNAVPYTEHSTKCKNSFPPFNNSVPPTIWQFNTKEEKVFECYCYFRSGVWMFFISHFWPVWIITVWQSCNNLNNGYFSDKTRIKYI